MSQQQLSTIRGTGGAGSSSPPPPAQPVNKPVNKPAQSLVASTDGRQEGCLQAAPSLDGVTLPAAWGPPLEGTTHWALPDGLLGNILQRLHDESRALVGWATTIREGSLQMHASMQP
jgi:hypothetical protein